MDDVVAGVATVPGRTGDIPPRTASCSHARLGLRGSWAALWPCPVKSSLCSSGCDLGRLLGVGILLGRLLGVGEAASPSGSRL